MNPQRLAAMLITLLFAGNAVQSVNAGPVTWAFEGVVTLVEDRNDILAGDVEVGSLLSGYYTFESTTPTISPGDGVYDDALTDMFGAVGRTNFTGPIGTFNRIYVFNDISSADSYVLVAGVRFAGTNAFLQIVLDDSTGAMFQSNALPVVPPGVNAIDADGARFALGTLDETLGINGRITRLVPEPGTAGFVAIGLLFLELRRRKHRRSQGSETRRLGGRSHSDRRTLFLGLAMGSVLCAGAPSEANDCNHNFVEDSTEIGVCPAFDLVFLLDSSNSSTNDLQEACLKIQGTNGILADLRAYLGNDHVYGQILNLGDSGGGQLCPANCCSDTVAGAYCRPPNNTGPLCASFGQCPNPEGGREDWGPATAVVAGNKTWTSGAIRIIIPVVDEGARCGNNAPSIDGQTNCVDDPGLDRDAINNAIPIVLPNNVIVMPIVAPSDNSRQVTAAVTRLAQDLAAHGAPGGKVFSSVEEELIFKVADYIRSLCPATDCNGNGVLDECDIADGTSRDCHRRVNPCCQARSGAGCPDDISVRNAVCNTLAGAACCSTEWTIACARIAEALGFCTFVVRPDAVPDDCQLSGDCNNNGIYNECDLLCGTPLGVCIEAGCGIDCNNNCVPDSCDLAACGIGSSPTLAKDPLCDDCNGNFIPDQCDIVAGTPDVNLDGVPDECAACCFLVDLSCQNRLPSACPSPDAEAHEGVVCSACVCGEAACCTGSVCSITSGCACTAGGGVLLGPRYYDHTPDCQPDPCLSGSCCTASGCKDSRETTGHEPMTASICNATPFNGSYIGGVRCKGGKCNNSLLSENGLSCSQVSDCNNGEPPGTICEGSTAQLAQPSPCPTLPAPVASPLQPLGDFCNGTKNRFISLENPNAGLTAMQMTMVDLQHPIPDNLPANPPPNFSGYESGTCAPRTCLGGAKNGAICVLPAPVPTDCPSPGVCTTAVESNGCARWVGKPGTFLEAQDIPLGASNHAARLQCTPFYYN